MLPKWEIWLNSNLSPIIAKWMQEATGWVVKSSYILQLNDAEDLTIYNAAKKKGHVIIVSKDKDFVSLVELFGAPPKLILIKKENCDNRVLWDFIRHRIDQAIAVLVNSDVDIAELE
jgi:predicted nuclease of predicted toxin-antitoxin system